jgi:phage shock protein PspC (stress-responsive transcriptional regulator)
MKKTVTINLAGQVYNMDEDAFGKLKNYLSAIESHFSKEAERTEIISDIEARIAELFTEKITPSKSVITLIDVNEIMGILGKPEDFGDVEGSQQEKTSHGNSYAYRRMYRDPDHRVIGGVCSGIGAYFRIDPVILRILFLIAFFGFGVGIIVYIILWIVLPEARTAAQKLEMRGEPVTIDNIGKTIRDEFNSVKNNMNFSRKRT